MSDLDNALTKLENVIAKIRSNSGETWLVDVCDTILNPDADLISVELEVHVKNSKTVIDNKYTLQFPYTNTGVLTATEKAAVKILVTEFRTMILRRVSDAVQRAKEQFTSIGDEVLQDFEKYIGDKNDKIA